MAALPFQMPRGEQVLGETDETIVVALSQGNPRAEILAWNRFAPGVGRTIRRLLGPEPDCEDLRQEVLFRFFRRIKTLRDPTLVRGFLTGICVHVVREEIGRRRRRRWLHLTVTAAARASATVEQVDTDAREAIARYYRVLEKLAAGERSVFAARTIEGLSLTQVANVHGISISTTQRRLARASKKVALLVRRDPILMSLVRSKTHGESDEL